MSTIKIANYNDDDDGRPSVTTYMYISCPHVDRK